MADFSGFKLGRRPRKLDTRTPVMGRLIRANPLPPAPLRVDMPAVASWPMLANDTIGDCAIAASLHQVQAWQAACGRPLMPAADAAVSVYSAATGYQPGTPGTDQGAVELDILQFWMRTGMAVNDTAALDLLDGFAVLDAYDDDQVRRCIAAFGGVYAGLALPNSARSQDVWDVPKGGANGAGAPASWGLHAVSLLGFNEIGPICVSWGTVVPMTWRFWRTYSEEAYALLSGDWLTSGASPRGSLWRSLVADIRVMSGNLRFA